MDSEFAVNQDLRGFNLMTLPVEILRHVLSFLPMEVVVNFAFVSRQSFEVAKGLTWECLDFSLGNYWLKDVVNFCDRAQATCQSLILPSCFRYASIGVSKGKKLNWRQDAKWVTILPKAAVIVPSRPSRPSPAPTNHNRKSASKNADSNFENPQQTELDARDVPNALQLYPRLRRTIGAHLRPRPSRPN